MESPPNVAMVASNNPASLIVKDNKILIAITVIYVALLNLSTLWRHGKNLDIHPYCCATLPNFSY
jgi:hypothetical protein